MPGAEHRPVATAIIVTRDRPVLLRRAIAAIEAQDVPGVVETIVVFDRSEPDLSLVREDGDRPVRVVANGRSPGLPGGRNTGAALATGDILTFCDDDDEWLPGKLARQLEVFEQEPDVEVVVTGLLVDYEGREIARPSPETITFDDLLRRRVMEANFVTAAVRRSAFWDSIGPADETLPGGYAEDYEWMLRAARRRPIRVIPDPLVRIHWHGSSFYAGRWRVIDEGLERLLELHSELQRGRAGHARILGQRAFAQAASGQRRRALGTALRAARANPIEARSYLALAVASGVVSADRIRTALHRRGRGI